MISVGEAAMVGLRQRPRISWCDGKLLNYDLCFVRVSRHGPLWERAQLAPTVFYSCRSSSSRVS